MTWMCALDLCQNDYVCRTFINHMEYQEEENQEIKHALKGKQSKDQIEARKDDLRGSCYKGGANIKGSN